MPKSLVPPIPYGRQSVDGQDIAAVEAVLKDDWLTQGPRIGAFEDAVARKAAANYAVAVSSGTAALHSACFAAGLEDGDEAIVPALTFSATAASVRLLGGEVRFADVDAETLGLSATNVESVLSPKTRALLGVDFAGQPCDWNGLTEICADRRITVIADAAHSLGATYQGRSVGSLADMTCFSFHPVKAITSAEGGMTLTSSEELALRLRAFRGHGIVRDEARFVGSENEDIGPWSYEIQDIGLNYRISDMQCALGLSQLQKLDRFISRRNDLASQYAEAFSGFDLLECPHVLPDRTSAWHLYAIRLNLEALQWTRRQVFEELRHRGVGVQVHYMPLHLQPYYRDRYGHKRGDFPNAEAYYDAALSLPLFPAMSEQNVADVAEIVTDVLNAAKR